MPRKGMRSIFSSPSNTLPPSSPPHPTFSESLIQENMESAEAIIRKWDLNSTNFTRISYLFADSRNEARDFLKSVSDLQEAMHMYVSLSQHSVSSHHKLVNAQNLMQIAIRRLEKELYQLLSTNRDQLDPDSISGRSSHASEASRTSTSDFEDEIGSELDDVPPAAAAGVYTVAMTDLRLISECMISAGYGKECVRIYNIIRKSVVDEGLYRLGIEQLTPSQVSKMDWEVLDLKIKNWVNTAKTAMKTFFTGERILCDYVFSSSDSIRESCFAEITREGANILFSFPEMIAKGKKSPEKMFRILDLYDTISELWPEIEAVFYFESTSIVRSQAISSLIKLGDAVRSMLTDFEAAIQKDSSKSAVPGGGIHPLTRYVMNYIGFLSDYSGVLSDITTDWPLPNQSSLPAVPFYDDPNSDEFQTSATAARFAWLVLVLLCKLDGKTELFKDVSLSYLFLANNLHYVISKVSSSNLKFLLGEEWISKHEMKMKQYSANYERIGWNKVLSSLPKENPSAQISVEEAKEYFRRFSSAFETTYRKQSSWVVSDAKLRDGIKMSLRSEIVPAYQEFYRTYRPALRNERHIDAIVRFTPDDISNYLSDLFYGKGNSTSSSRGTHSV